MALVLLGGVVGEQAGAWAEGEEAVVVEWEEHDPGLGPAGVASVPTAVLESLIRWGLRATI